MLSEVLDRGETGVTESGATRLKFRSGHSGSAVGRGGNLARLEGGARLSTYGSLLGRLGLGCPGRTPSDRVSQVSWKNTKHMQLPEAEQLLHNLRPMLGAMLFTLVRLAPGPGRPRPPESEIAPDLAALSQVWGEGL